MSARAKDPAERFATIYVRTDDGRHRRQREVRCGKCGYPTRIYDNGREQLPPEAVAKKFRERGWALNGTALCPRCQAGKKPMSPAARRAAFCAINNRGQEHRMTAPTPAAKAAPPPVATAADRRRIRDALEEHYDEDAARYRASWSDKALAAKLDVPAKWVHDIREVGGYGPDENEATAVRTAEIDDVRAEVAQLQTDLLERFDRLEAKVRKLNPGGLQ